MAIRATSMLVRVEVYCGGPVLTYELLIPPDENWDEATMEEWVALALEMASDNVKERLEEGGE